MLIVMDHRATPDQIRTVVDTIDEMGYRAKPIPGYQRIAIGLVGNDGRVEEARLVGLPGVREVIKVSKPYKQVSREWREENTLVRLENGTVLGGPEVVLMAGPCAVESRGQILEIADRVRHLGASVLRGGAFKPRTSPYSFQGLGEVGLKYLAEAREITGLPVISEVMTIEAIDMVAEYVDILQIGARNMQNYGLLQAVGKVQRPVMLKRGISGEINELLMCAEYILSNGNMEVMLCERGIRTYETATRNTFDLNAIPVLKRASHLPVVADPAHGTGDWELVPPMSLAAVAAGADALILEVHPDPESAMSDGDQSLKPERFAELMGGLRKVAEAVGRTVASPGGQEGLPVNGDGRRPVLA